MNFLFLIIVAAVLVFPAMGQTCTCESNFEWMKKAFEENDAGFLYIIDKKGQAAYNLHNQLMLEKVKVTKTSTECIGLLREWLKFFRSGHINIERLTNEVASSETVHETRKVDISKFEKYINTKKEADYEGVWQIGDHFKIGIQKEGMNYIGFIIKSNVDGWKEPGQVYLQIEQDGDKLFATLFRRDHSLSHVNSEPELIGKNYLQIDQMVFKRLKPIFPNDPDDPIVEKYAKSINSRNPYLEELNATTLFLRIPSFEDKSVIEEVLIENKNKLLKTENLIIDLRNNVGGTDESFTELLPFLYTNPIRTVSVEFLSTKQNNQQFLDASTDTDWDENMRRWAKNIYDKLQEKLGEFVNPFDTPIDIYRQDTVYEYPQNVGIIINEEIASAAEAFLLVAKQSKKVKLFGVATAGALDISNMASMESPCKEFSLEYCLSRSLRIPGMTIDDIGIQPDYYLDKTIPQYKWVEYVNEILNY